jgi:hypothetical protein
MSLESANQCGSNGVKKSPNFPISCQNPLLVSDTKKKKKKKKNADTATATVCQLLLDGFYHWIGNARFGACFWAFFYMKMGGFHRKKRLFHRKNRLFHKKCKSSRNSFIYLYTLPYTYSILYFCEPLILFYLLLSIELSFIIFKYYFSRTAFYLLLLFSRTHLLFLLLFCEPFIY